MTAPASQPVRRGSAVRMSQVTLEDHSDVARGIEAFRMVSTPHPIHYATIIRHGRLASWVVTFTSKSIIPKPYRFPEWDTARAVAAEGVARLAGRDLHVFTRAQSLAMGQQRCPRIVSGNRACSEPAEVGTVWCQWHPKGGEHERL